MANASQEVRMDVLLTFTVNFNRILISHFVL